MFYYSVSANSSSEDEVGVLVDEGDYFVVVLGFLVVGAVALEDVAVGEG